jgi:putative oxidoreductase
MFRKLISTPDDYTYTLVRLILGVVFFAHGAQKMLGWFGGYGFSGTMGFFTQQLHIPAPFAFLAICAEFFGGLGLLVGLLSRVAAFGISVNMVVAIFTVHIHNGFFANWFGQQKGEGYEYHLLALALLTTVMIKGGGALSIDRALSKPSTGGEIARPRSGRTSTNQAA